jgi:cell division protein FtsW (lipid II flippase)
MKTVFQTIYDFIGWVVEEIGFLGVVIISLTLFLIVNAISRGINIRKSKKEFDEND